MFDTVSLLTVVTAIAFALAGAVMSRSGLDAWHTISSMKKNYIQYIIAWKVSWKNKDEKGPRGHSTAALEF